MKPKKVNIGSRVYLEWVDSYSPGTTTWQDYDEYDILTIRSVGIIVDNNANCITITNSVTENGGCTRPLVIPWCCITKFQQFEQIVTITKVKENETD